MQMSQAFKEQFAAKIFSERTRIREWFEKKFAEFPPPFYCSIDLRDSGGKIAPVDCNLYPAGFNNICEFDLEASPPLFRKQIEKMAKAHLVKEPEKILIIPESHTENKFYLENLYYLKSILGEAGYETAFGRYVSACDGSPNTLELITHSEKRIVQETIKKINGTLQTTTGFVPDWIILNNDFSQGYPDCLDGVNQPIFPSHKLGWHSRRKSTHFDFYNRLAIEFANLIGIDPWKITIASRSVEGVNFNEGIGMDRLIQTADEMLAELREKHAQLGITRNPALFIKNDSGTYGMGIMVIESTDELRTMNRRTKNKMSVGKGKSAIENVIVQEGVPTAMTSDQFTGEPVIYMMGEELIGGFIRANTERGDMDNLNSPGAFFRKFCFKDLSDSLAVKTSKSCPDDFPSQEAVYGMIAKLSALAAAMEIKQL
jgi:glutamate--cysteine ligase